MKKIKYLISPIIGIILIYYSLSSITHNDRISILNSLKNVNFFWIASSLLMGIISHYIRSIRWNLLISTKYNRTPIYLNFSIILMSYLLNLGIPRSGEIFRSISLNKHTKIPTQFLFGTIILERIIDLICLGIIIIIIMFMNYDIITNLVSIQNILIIILSLFIFVIFYKIIGHKFKLINYISEKLINLKEGINSIFELKQKFYFFLLTVLIWILYIGMFYVIQFSFNSSDFFINFEILLISFVSGAFAMTTTNGGIGLYPIAISKTMEVFNIPIDVGLSYGWIMWSSQTLLILILGGLSFILLPVITKKSNYIETNSTSNIT